MDKNLYNTLDKQQLIKRLSSEKFDRITCSFYNYVQINNPEEVRNHLYEQFNKINILGRIYIAREGINAQISIPTNNWKKFNELFTQNTIFQGAYINKAIEEGKSFYKLKVKVKDEIVAYGMHNSAFDMNVTGQHLSSREFNREMNNPETIVVDMRNHYESQVGRFNGAILPNVETSRELLPKVNKLLQGKEGNQILLYCTGGIRCEKASSFLIKKGFKNVKQLKGGVINYANDVKSKNIPSKFIGKNFVFDARLGESITDDILGECHICKSPADKHTDCKNQICHILFLACTNCAIKFDGSCSYECQKIADLPIEEQRSLRKNKK